MVDERRLSAAKGLHKNGASAREAPRIFVMQSSGGITALAAAAREPVRTVLSGPAGGVVGAAATARASGFPRIIAFDMGGTSTDVSLVEGPITTASDAQVAGLPISVPMLDIHTVGAGGGSLARFDAAGVLRVGPESAGADPGPICYGRGTAAHGHRRQSFARTPSAHAFSGRRLHSRPRPHPPPHAEWLKQGEARLTLDKFAAGVIRVVNSTMEKAIRVVSIERGRDPRDFALVAFGGAGGLHACALAEALSIPQVIVPALPARFPRSAFCSATSSKIIPAPFSCSDREQASVTRTSHKNSPALEVQAAKDFKKEAWKGRVQYRRSVDIRYRGQGYELNLPFTEKSAERFPSRTPPPLWLRPRRSRSRASNPPPPRYIAGNNSRRKDGPCGDEHSCAVQAGQSSARLPRPKPRSSSMARNSQRQSTPVRH